MMTDAPQEEFDLNVQQESADLLNLLNRAGWATETAIHWIELLDALISNPDPQELQNWLQKNGATLDRTIVPAIRVVADRLIEDTTLAATHGLRVLDQLSVLLLLGIPSPIVSSDEWVSSRLLDTLRQIEMWGIGPAYTSARTQADTLTRVLNFRGCRLAERWEFLPAEVHLRAAIAVDPTFAPAYCNHLRVVLHLNEIEDALTDCRKLRAVDPGYLPGKVSCEMTEKIRRARLTYEATVTEIAEKTGLIDLLRVYDRPETPEANDVTLETYLRRRAAPKKPS